MSEHDEHPRDVTKVTALLQELLEEQLGLYEQLRGLADRQRLLVTQEDPQPLLALLGERQKVVDDLSSLSGRLMPVQHDWRSQGREIDGDTRQVIDGLLQRIAETLQSVLDSDAEDARRLAARKENTRQDMSRVQEGQRALNAYQAAGGAAAGTYAITDQSI